MKRRQGRQNLGDRYGFHVRQICVLKLRQTIKILDMWNCPRRNLIPRDAR